MIGKEETKLLQYAEDTTAVLADTDSAKVLFELLDLFKDINRRYVDWFFKRE